MGWESVCIQRLRGRLDCYTGAKQELLCQEVLFLSPTFPWLQPRSQPKSAIFGQVGPVTQGTSINTVI